MGKLQKKLVRNDVITVKSRTELNNPLQRVIDSSARLIMHQRRVSVLGNQSVLQAKPAWLRKLFQEGKHVGVQATVAHSPGPYTGPVSLLNPVSTSLNYVDKYKSDGLSELGKSANTGMGYTMASASLTGDLVGIGMSVLTIHENRADRNAEDYATKKEALAATKTASTDLGTQLADVGSQLTSIIGSTSSTASYATNAAQAAPFIAAPINMFVGARAAVSAGRAGKYQNAFDKIAQEGGELSDQAIYAKKQMRKRRIRQGIGAAGAFLGTAGSIALGVGLVAGTAAVMATPVGWALAGAGALVALGIGAHKAYQYIKKRRKGKEELGRVRAEHAGKIIDALHPKELISEERPDYTVFADEPELREKKKLEAQKFLMARGIKPEKLDPANRGKNIDYLKRKLKSW